MPRPRKEAGAEPKKRSRTGCWPCKARKVKCGEEKPVCANCAKSGEGCDYSIRLNWGGRSRKDADGGLADPAGFTFVATPTSTSQPKTKSSNGHGHEHIFSAQHIATAPPPPSSRPPPTMPTPEPTPGSDAAILDPRLHVPPPSRSFDVDYKRPGQAQHHIPRSHPSPTSTDHTSPFTTLNDDFSWSPQHSAKRMRLSPPAARAAPVFAIPPSPNSEQLLGASHSASHSINSVVNAPSTPGSSLPSNSPHVSQALPHTVQTPADLRRLSVKSLLSDPSDESSRPPSVRPEGHGYRTYGYDHGFPDLDIPRNDDAHVVLPRLPDMRRQSRAVSDISSDDSDDARLMAFEPGGYYAQPVPVKISCALEPLPRELLENQMNLLYFHHFINHSGRILVVHNCPDNPFRVVLPQMAVRNPQLLHLLLAYSASHRAKLLNHPEPANRIAEWMSDVLPALRESLNEPGASGAASTDPTDPSSLAPLATAIMLASMEIMLPASFTLRIPWQKHLQIARQIIVTKGGLDHLAQKADGARDKAIFFLSRWFAYLDVMGSLSNRHEQPLFGAYLEDGGGLWLVNRDGEEIYQIDCFFGFSGLCISLLAQVAELTAQCDNQRIDPVTNQVKAGWHPPEYVRRQAEELKGRLIESADREVHGCMHSNATRLPTAAGSRHHAPSPAEEEASQADYNELHATNRAYHYAGIIHLFKRVLALPTPHSEVQKAVRAILSCLEKVRHGSTAEMCLLFPMFTAGCEALREEDRGVFITRMREVEGWGMQHVGRSMQIMREVWDTGRGWETLVNGEFFG